MKLVKNVLLASLVLATAVPQVSPFFASGLKQKIKNSGSKGPRYNKKPKRRHKTITQQLQLAHANNLKTARKLYNNAIMRLLHGHDGIFAALYHKFNSLISLKDKTELQLSCLLFVTGTTQALDAYLENRIKFLLGPKIVGDIIANHIAEQFDDWYI